VRRRGVNRTGSNGIRLKSRGENEMNIGREKTNLPTRKKNGRRFYGKHEKGLRRAKITGIGFNSAGEPTASTVTKGEPVRGGGD